MVKLIPKISQKLHQTEFLNNLQPSPKSQKESVDFSTLNQKYKKHRTNKKKLSHKQSKFK